MSPEQIEVERKAFEAKHQRFDLSGDIGDWTKRWRYDSPIIDAMWEGWLARAEKAQRVREALEACASAMEIQQGRMAESFHLSAEAFTPIWRAAIDAARAALKD